MRKNTLTLLYVKALSKQGDNISVNIHWNLEGNLDLTELDTVLNLISIGMQVFPPNFRTVISSERAFYTQIFTESKL